MEQVAVNPRRIAHAQSCPRLHHGRDDPISHARVGIRPRPVGNRLGDDGDGLLRIFFDAGDCVFVYAAADGASLIYSAASIPNSFTFLFSVFRLIPRKSAALVFTPPQRSSARSISACSIWSITS